MVNLSLLGTEVSCMSRKCPSWKRQLHGWEEPQRVEAGRYTTVNIVGTLVQSSRRQLAREESNLGSSTDSQGSRIRYHRVFLIPNRKAP